MTVYRNEFPNCVAGFGSRYRRPLAVPAFDALSRKMAEIYNGWPLHDDDRSRLLDLHAWLRGAQIDHTDGSTTALKQAERALAEFIARVEVL